MVTDCHILGMANGNKHLKTPDVTETKFDGI